MIVVIFVTSQSPRSCFKFQSIRQVLDRRDVLLKRRGRGRAGEDDGRGFPCLRSDSLDGGAHHLRAVGDLRLLLVGWNGVVLAVPGPKAPERYFAERSGRRSMSSGV